MSAAVPLLGQQTLRGTDSNSLLRLYDLLQEACSRSPSQQERARAAKTRQRIATELQKRRVPFTTGRDDALRRGEARIPSSS
jgi:hypothetical protein